MSQVSPQPVYTRSLSCGTLNVTPTGGAAALDTLFDIAERRNPKRAFLFVSKVLGRHIPVSPTVMRGVYRQLAEQLPASIAGPVLFIGMAETAVGLGAGVFDEVRQRVSDAVYLTSTRHPQDGELLCEFKEAHSHATDHLIYLPDDEQLRRRVLDSRTLILIDDEATTGNTFINLLAALRETTLFKHLQQVFAVTLTDWSGSALAQRCPLPIQSISLVQGDWQWVPEPDAPLPVMPTVNVTARGNVAITGKQSWGRLGMVASAGDLGRDLCVSQGEKILVLGSSEFVWEPFLLAEHLHTQGAEVKFGSTTRSPIANGFAIQSAITFNDNYGLGIANFVYNVLHQRFDRILLCVETPPESVDSQLLDALATVAPQVEIISYD
ncbi:phosphoribosyltransferase domain-containing protein [Pectobacterium versatile]|uniref:Adenine/guanine phosphoribosyltransferase n=1 Tax=Pectobacterium versatile TaxID=2488639 RepID=A0A855MJR0_9GAMM|nr:phosphoribosyltransferase domain-containing protein [Pectobacterium versatile]POY50943.1 adenine/guanine phosphoribosyltransferase [Pectobacterium versatile]QPK15128.1 phosphoribosyltransferase domain-containing protein [Pectobacterium versatile]